MNGFEPLTSTPVGSALLLSYIPIVYFLKLELKLLIKAKTPVNDYFLINFWGEN